MSKHTYEDYSSKLTSEDITTETIISVLDMIKEDQAHIDELASKLEANEKHINELRETNHKLFIRVTSDEPDNKEEPSSEIDYRAKLREMIEKGDI